MPTRIVRLDIPELSPVRMDQLALSLFQYANTAAGSTMEKDLRLAARVVEAVRLGLLQSDADSSYDYESMSTGEVALVRSFNAMSEKVEVIIGLIRERLAEDGDKKEKKPRISLPTEETHEGTGR